MSPAERWSFVLRDARELERRARRRLTALGAGGIALGVAALPETGS